MESEAGKDNLTLLEAHLAAAEGRLGPQAVLGDIPVSLRPGAGGPWSAESALGSVELCVRVDRSPQRSSA